MSEIAVTFHFERNPINIIQPKHLKAVTSSKCHRHFAAMTSVCHLYLHFTFISFSDRNNNGIPLIIALFVPVSTSLSANFNRAIATNTKKNRKASIAWSTMQFCCRQSQQIIHPDSYRIAFRWQLQIDAKSWNQLNKSSTWFQDGKCDFVFLSPWIELLKSKL